MLLVSDANIFIDFEAAELVERLFCLPYEIAVPDVLYEQELAGRHAHLLSLGLQLRALSGELVAEAYGMQTKYPEPSVNDLLALVLAKSLDCPLVTGDRRLRDAAQAEGLDLLGTLALVEQMLANALVSLDEVEEAYERMRKAGRRLPWGDVKAQLRCFRQVR